LLLGNWLDWTDVARLDCALLSKRARPIFLTTLSTTVFLNLNSKNAQLKPLDIFAQWLHLRSIRVKNLSLHGVPAATAEACLALSADVLTFLSVVTVDANYLRMSEMGDLSNVNSVPLEVVANHCHRLERFEYSGNVLCGQGLQALLRANPKMSRVDLAGNLRGKRRPSF